jgi:hypothetical protein
MILHDPNRQLCLETNFLLPLPLPASLSEAIVAPVGGREREDAEEDVAIDAEPTPLPPPPPVPLPLTSVAERRPASSREPTDSIVGHTLDDAVEYRDGHLSGYLTPELVNGHVGCVRVQNMM